LVALAVFGWAFPGTFVRLMPHLPVLPLVGLRLSMAFLALLPLLTVKSVRLATAAAIREWRCWVLALGMLSYYSVATSAFLFAPVGEVALIIASAPLFAVILRAIGKKPVTQAELFGSVLAVVGVVTMATPAIRANHSASSHQWLGILLAVLAAISAASYAIGNRHLASLGRAHGAIPQAGLTFFLGLLLLPAAFSLPFHTFMQPQMAWLIPLGFMSTALPTVAIAASSHRISPIAVTMINPLTSVCANVVAALAIHEIPSIWTWAGGTLIVTAVMLASLSTANRRNEVEV
jgi:drug/metabolite transporter (DMT)-like permease